MNFRLKLDDVHSFQKERQLQKSCVFFGEECTVHVIVNSGLMNIHERALIGILRTYKHTSVGQLLRWK